jgi:hypothetical protein
MIRALLFLVGALASFPFLAYIIAIYSSLTGAYVAEILIAWFLPEQWGIYVPGYWELAGLLVLFGFLFHKPAVPSAADYPNDKETLDDGKHIAMLIFNWLIRPWTILFVGWLVHVRFFIW